MALSVSDVMAKNRGAGPGFDLLRLGASLMVILLHSFQTAYGRAPFVGTPMAPIFAAVLPIFFALSGFLVAGSALRTRNIKVFLAFRVLRIVPALAVEITMSAVVLGAMFTTLPLAAYYANPGFLTYFGNMVGWIHFNLPGVFAANPKPAIVNNNLWTLHPEFECYAALALLMLTRLAYNRWFMTVFWLAGTIVGAAINAKTGQFEAVGVFPAPVLVYYFVTGLVFYHWRERIIVDYRLFIAAVVVSFILLLLPQTTFVVPIAVTYIMVWLGMCNFPRIEWLQRGDYSYGLYLYSYPLQQTIVALSPAARHWWIVFPLTVILTLGVAMASWNFIEKPALRLKAFVNGRPKPIASTTEPPPLEAADPPFAGTVSPKGA